MKTERFFRVLTKVNAIVLLLAGLAFLGLMLNVVLEEYGIGRGGSEFGCFSRGYGPGGEVVFTARDSLLTFGNFNAVPGSSWARAAIMAPVFPKEGEPGHIRREIVNHLFINSETGESRRLLPHDESVFLVSRSDDLEYFGWEGGPCPILVFFMSAPVGTGTDTKDLSNLVDMVVSRPDGSGVKTLVSGKGQLKLVRMNPRGNVAFYYGSWGELMMIEVDPVSMEIMNKHQVNLESSEVDEL